MVTFCNQNNVFQKEAAGPRHRSQKKQEAGRFEKDSTNWSRSEHAFNVQPSRAVI